MWLAGWGLGHQSGMEVDSGCSDIQEGGCATLRLRASAWPEYESSYSREELWLSVPKAFLSEWQRLFFQLLTSRSERLLPPTEKALHPASFRALHDFLCSRSEHFSSLKSLNFSERPWWRHCGWSVRQRPDSDIYARKKQTRYGQTASSSWLWGLRCSGFVGRI